MEIVTQVTQFILSLSILIVLHEMGHFIPAKLFKTRVEKFYLFFDPWFSLFKVKRGDTEYGIGWLPLGGYVKISGMIDESMDKEQMKLPPQSWEFRSKPAWQRLIIMIGGVTVNVILGILIYAMVLFAWGEEYLPTKNVTYGIAADSLGMSMGLKDGDKILSVNNVEVPNFSRIPGEILLNEPKTIQVERDGQRLDIPVTEENISEMIASRGKNMLVAPRFPCIIDSLEKGAPAEKSGLKKGDKIIAVNGIPASFHNQVTGILRKNPNTVADIIVLRGNDTIPVKTQITLQGTIGFYPKDPTQFFKLDTIHYGFFESFPAGIHKANETFGNYIKQMKVLVTVKDAHKQIGGFGTIASAYSTSWDWERFWTFTAFLSIVLAIMNILPIPALDGGHVMFLLYEVITRRKPNEKFMEYAQYAGMLLLLALLLYANGNDVVRWFGS
ncbi:MAG: peptidase [Bacteroidota bacterium]|jgi:regulator of sigma E protease|nr:peptidase [Bacteroidota bacterium]